MENQNEQRGVSDQPAQSSAERRAPAPSLFVAAIVGTVLTVINQWDACVGAARLAWVPLILTYCVPFCVATYGTFSALPQATGRSEEPARPPETAKL